MSSPKVRLYASQPDENILLLMYQDKFIYLDDKSGWKFYETTHKSSVTNLCFRGIIDRVFR